jgi:putative intracellular protease/amidase
MKILMVLTSHDRLGNTGKKTGFWPDWQPYVVTDGRFITGQNPASSEAAANAVVAQLTRPAHAR